VGMGDSLAEKHDAADSTSHRNGRRKQSSGEHYEHGGNPSHYLGRELNLHACSINTL